MVRRQEPEVGLTVARLSLVAEVPAATTKWLTREGLLRPSVQETSGQGTANVYDRSDATALLAYRLLRTDASSETVRAAMKFFQAKAGRAVLVRAQQALESGGEDETLVLLDENGAVRVTSVDKVARELAMMTKARHCAVHVLHPLSMVERVFLRLTEEELRGRQRRPRKRRRQRLPALLMEATA